jgi:hypothetical protein
MPNVLTRWCRFGRLDDAQIVAIAQALGHPVTIV